jgi:hypothetical protein
VPALDAIVTLDFSIRAAMTVSGKGPDRVTRYRR